MKINTKTVASILVVVLGVIIIMVIIRMGVPNSGTTKIPLQQIMIEVSPVAIFTWRYEAGGDDLDELPKTVIFLDVTYQSGRIFSLKIEEVQGSCNDIDASEDDADMVLGTTKIQCYAAGFGETYKIVKSDVSYQVMRKYIEEGSPEIASAEFKNEKIAEVPLLQ